MYCVVYDGNCNLCATLVQFLETLDGGDRFRYVPMQDTQALGIYNITATDCELGMILIDAQHPERRWQGSNAAEEIGRLLPLGHVFVSFYRALPGIKPLGDRAYEQIRDNRYSWFGRRSQTYHSAYPLCSSDCSSETCNPNQPPRQNGNHASAPDPDIA